MLRNPNLNRLQLSLNATDDSICVRSVKGQLNFIRVKVRAKKLIEQRADRTPGPWADANWGRLSRGYWTELIKQLWWDWQQGALQLSMTLTLPCLNLCFCDTRTHTRTHNWTNWNVPSRALFFSREMTSRPLSVSQPNSRLKIFFSAGAEQESACALFPILWQIYHRNVKSCDDNATVFFITVFEHKNLW